MRRVDCRRAPELAGLADEARAFADAMYPRVCALLLDAETRPPGQFDLVLRPLASGNHGEAHLPGKIYLNSHSLTNVALGADRLQRLLVHEMAHLATVRPPGWRRWWSSPVAAERAWQESIADFARFKIVGTEGPACARCDAATPSYTDGYPCGGAFLLYLDARYGSNLVRQLVRRLHDRAYQDTFFQESTGKPLDILWAEFQQTPAFLPSAQEALDLRAALGFVEGRPPRDVRKRFDRLVAERGDDFTRKALAAARLPGRPKGAVAIASRLVLYTYLRQPGGPPERFLLELRDQGRLPGVPGGETGWTSRMTSFEAMASRRFPATCEIVGQFDGDPSRSDYHYLVSRVSLESPWTLDQAWRTGPGGDFIEEYPVSGAADAARTTGAAATGIEGP